MATATDQDRFEAAVKIIHGLPKDGPFQPSNDMKLKFYGLYKQATLGPCTASQPAFWDVVNRAKWGAWKGLGDMSKEDAMRNYVEILKEVVETMTLDNNVQDFLEKMGPIYEFVTDDGRVVSTRPDINFLIPENAAKAMPNKAKGGNQLVNGGHSPEKVKPANGNVVTNGAASGNHHMSSEESELDDEVENRHQPRIFVGANAVRKSDLEACSDEEEFDDASDNQAFAAITVDIAPIQSSGSHSPLSYGSTPRRSSKIVQLNGDSAKSLESDKTAATLLTSSVKLNPLSPTRRRAATALGQLLRQLPEIEVDKVTTTDVLAVANADGTVAADGESSEDSIVRAWAVLRRIHSEQVQRAQDDDDWLIRRLKRLKRGKSGHRKHRGRGGNNEKSGSSGEGAGNGSEDGGNAAEGPPQQDDANVAGGPSSRRSQRQLSGESGSSSSSSGADSANLDFDPHVGAVLLRMHRELQHINRQLELVEGILITQQQMIRNVIATSNEAQQKKMRLGFFSNLPWRTILFILAWPVVVNVVVRLCIFKIRRRR